MKDENWGRGSLNEDRNRPRSIVNKKAHTETKNAANRETGQ